MPAGRQQQNVLVTGANSGLGLGICLRLIDDFLHQHGSSTRSLNIIYTTRSQKKASDTLKTLEAHLAKHDAASRARVTLQAETNVELTNLLSVRSLAKRMNASKLTQLDAVFCNAGIGGWSGMNWPLTFWTVINSITSATTWPPGKLGIVGALTDRQLDPTTLSKPEPPLGQVFCSNFFGHYMLSHWLMPLLRACPIEEPGKIMFVSSIEPLNADYNEDDLQGLRTDRSYESSKRVFDLLTLTSNQPASLSSFKQFTSQPAKDEGVLDDSSPRPDNSVPEMHVFHPGIIVSAVAPVPFPLNHVYPIGIALARLAGGVWSTVSSYAAAHVATWLLFTSSHDIQKAEQDAQPGGMGKVKWGTRAFALGATEVRPTEVDRWGINGSGTPFGHTWWGKGYGRAPNSVDATKEDVENFIVQGSRLWSSVEDLRMDWQRRISEFDQNIKSPKT